MSIISDAGVCATWINVVIEVLPLVQPDLSETRIVAIHDLARAPREGVGSRLTKDMSDM